MRIITTSNRAADIAGDGAVENADDDRNKGRGEANRKGDPAAEQNAREQIAAEDIRAQPDGAALGGVAPSARFVCS